MQEVMKNPRRIVYETMLALSRGEVSIDHCFAMSKLAHEERGLATEERLHMELAIKNGYIPLDYQTAKLAITAKISE